MPDEAEAALTASEGICVGGWTLRWVGDCWSAGTWKERSTGSRTWRDASFYNELRIALQVLLERNVEGEVSELAEVLERVESVYQKIGDALRDIITK